MHYICIIKLNAMQNTLTIDQIQNIKPNGYLDHDPYRITKYTDDSYCLFLIDDSEDSDPSPKVETYNPQEILDYITKA